MHDEDKAIQEIKGLSRNAKNYLSHTLRHGLCHVLSAHVRSADIEKALHTFEAEVVKMGL